MSKITRHEGVVRSTGSRVFVVWREIPDDPKHCLVIYRDSIPEVYNYAVTELIMGRGQDSIDLWEVMDKIGYLDQRKMLDVLHGYGYIRKQRTCDIDMHVGNGNKICLEELNASIAEQASPREHKDGTVSEYNPFNPKVDDDGVERTTIVDRLLADAEKYAELSKETYERAYAIDPTRRPSEAPQDDAERRVFYIELSEGISQAKAIEAVKKELAARKA